MAKKVKKNKDKTMSIAIISLIGVLLVYGIYQVIGPMQTSKVDEKFGECLLNSEAIFYGTEWCGHCKNQKATLGNIFTEYKDDFYVDCDENPVECSAAGIKGYPTWVVNGKQYPGARSIEDLSSILSC